MNRKLCAPADRARSWESIDWKKAEAYVKKLQMRIVKAQKDGHYSKVKTLQWLLTHSFYAKALAVKRVTSNKGKNTAGVDHELWKTPKGKCSHLSFPPFLYGFSRKRCDGVYLRCSFRHPVWQPCRTQIAVRHTARS